MTFPGSPTVFVIDDAAVGESIQGLLKSLGLRSDSFGTAQEYLTSKRSGQQGAVKLCPQLQQHLLLFSRWNLDIVLPGRSLHFP
jgi:FixJ family two-component response regulator